MITQCRAADEAEILALFEQWNRHLLRADPAGVAGLYAPDAILLPTLSAEPRLTTAERIDYFRHFLADRPSGTLDTYKASIGCNTATLDGLYTFEFAATGQRLAARYSFAYRWDGHGWLISSHHSSLLPPA
ncbi:MAG TPA: DUF4440 domain-containing protein [Pseudomonas sp.]|uniref:DUF4440 domain-containing protein n=1 Tax=Pseudomonas sp. TaxID=306 RepID=UPI002B49CE13|nr:DUF4440 domain-containing protein [Pseudomonas sp.]HKS11498.1 DUF4440 domain-containing protein [Pseudomonas sp.]